MSVGNFIGITLTAARHIVALLRSHIGGDDEQFLTVALQVAAHEARQGHGKFALQVKELVDEARSRKSALERRPVPLAQPKGDLGLLLSASYPDTRLSSMVLSDDLRERLKRIILEQRQQHRLREYNLAPRRKILLIGPPGSGKTMTASALSGELGLPLLTVQFESLITRFLGETASKLKQVFDTMSNTRGVYLFDEFDAVGVRRDTSNDVGEIRRVLNSLLQLLENDKSKGLIIAATNHPDLLDPALFRRFDDVIIYSVPDLPSALKIIRARLAALETKGIDWKEIASETDGLSQAELTKCADEAAKLAILDGRTRITTRDLKLAFVGRFDFLGPNCR